MPLSLASSRTSFKRLRKARTMDELEVLEDLERGLLDEPEMDAQEVQADNGGDDARGLDEGEETVTEASDEVAANDGADAGKDVADGDNKTLASDLMKRMDSLEGNVLAAVSSEDSGSGASFDGIVTLTDEQWDYLQGSLQTCNTFACFSLLITCALLGVLLFTHFFGRVEHA